MRAVLTLVLLAAAPVFAQDATNLAQPGTLSGVVTDAETGLPVVGAGVVIPALGIGAVSQRDGRYAIEGVPAGTHAVRTGAYRYHLVTVQADVAETGGALDLALRPGAGAGCAAVHEHGEDGSHMDPGPDGER